MLRKRLVGVVTVRGGWAVQSFGYGRYLPLGRPEILVKNLDRWGADEILLQCIDRSRAGLGPDIALLQRVTDKGITTPLIYAGGIRNAHDGLDVIHAGADRIAVDSLLWDSRHAVRELEALVGAQAVIAALPLSMEAVGLMHYNYRTKSHEPIADEVLELLARRVVSEVLVIDWKGEGGQTFDVRLLDAFPLPSMPIIGFGGLAGADQLRGVLTRSNVVAAAVGNTLNYREHSVRLLKQCLGDLPLRAPSHQRWIEHG